jgi:hypothetical protein
MCVDVDSVYLKIALHYPAETPPIYLWCREWLGPWSWCGLRQGLQGAHECQGKHLSAPSALLLPSSQIWEWCSTFKISGDCIQSLLQYPLQFNPPPQDTETHM